MKVVEIHAPECTEVVTTRTKAIDQELKMVCLNTEFSYKLPNYYFFIIFVQLRMVTLESIAPE